MDKMAQWKSSILGINKSGHGGPSKGKNPTHAPMAKFANGGKVLGGKVLGGKSGVKFGSKKVQKHADEAQDKILFGKMMKKAAKAPEMMKKADGGAVNRLANEASGVINDMTKNRVPMKKGGKVKKKAC